jgi:hypothetical protein
MHRSDDSHPNFGANLGEYCIEFGSLSTGLILQFLLPISSSS